MRIGPEKDDKKVGDHSKGTVIDVVQEVTNWKGITTFQTVTVRGFVLKSMNVLLRPMDFVLQMMKFEHKNAKPAKGELMGGWVKLKTSKGKLLLERIETAENEEDGSDGDEDVVIGNPLNDDASPSPSPVRQTAVSDEEDGSGSDGEDGGPLPVSLSRYKVLSATVIREGSGKSSKKVGELEEGAEILALAAEIIDDGSTRVQFDRGWVSVTAAAGLPLLELIQPLDFSNGPLKFGVLATCTVRDGPDAGTTKVGEHKEGSVIEVVHEAGAYSF